MSPQKAEIKKLLRNLLDEDIILDVDATGLWNLLSPSG